MRATWPPRCRVDLAADRRAFALRAAGRRDLAGLTDEELGLALDLTVVPVEGRFVRDLVAEVRFGDAGLGLDVRRNAGVEAAHGEVLELRLDLLGRARLGQERAEARRIAAEQVGQVDAALEELALGEVRLAVLVLERPGRRLGRVVDDGADVERAVRARDVALGAGRDQVQVVTDVTPSSLSTSVSMLSPRRVPLVGADHADLTAVGELADDEDVAVDVEAGEVAVGDADTGSWKNQKPIWASPLLSNRSAPK